MAAKCDVCGKMINKYHITHAGDVVCKGVCLKVYRLESYLLRMEERRMQDETYNKTAYQQAREISGWISIWKHGNSEQRKRAAKVINSF